MELERQEQQRYALLAEVEEGPGGVSTGGESAYGADAAAIGQRMILEAQRMPDQDGSI